MEKVESKSWYIKYAPQNVEDLIFDSDEHKNLVTKWIEQDYIDGNVLFHGPYGLGKTVTAEILIRNLIKAENDYYFARERNVDEIRKVIAPYLNNAPKRSKKKIIYIEEMDKLHKDAYNLLKTGLMEKYQDKNSFIACTNYKKKIEGGVLSRFNYIIPFTGNNIDKIIERLKYILDSESAEYEENELIDFVKANSKVGIRELINQLQNSYISNRGKINFQTISKESGIEESIVSIILKIFSTIMNLNPKDRRICVEIPEQSIIAEDYKTLVTILHNNYDINYDVIYQRIYETLHYIPAKKICAQYSEGQEFKKFPHINLLGFYYDVCKCIAEVTRM
ncbi:MAG: AAA family ATPase [bacterium]